jgi:hypothetical protein
MKLSLACEAGACRLTIPLERAEVFRDALATRNSGGAVSAFRDWRSGNTEPLLAEFPALSRLLAGWGAQRRTEREGHHPVWPPLFEVDATTEALQVEWESG